MKAKRIIIYNPRRFFLFTTLLIIILSIIIGSFLNLNKSYGQGEDKQFEYYVVKKGDTLWSIVSNHYSDKYDPRHLIYQVKYYNSLEDNIIYEGDTLKLPTL
ncbi:LysM peptidoglycan-binding domain-containing protein [Soehngenia saccharolytica]|jgi:hypothetical protein|nr:LysM peptidoglycan-binding domain-containing protein [Soehngenia saccharolytica]